MWHGHPFSQGRRTTERTMGVGIGGNREMWRRWGRQNLKKRGRQCRVGLLKIG